MMYRILVLHGWIPQHECNLLRLSPADDQLFILWNCCVMIIRECKREWRSVCVDLGSYYVGVSLVIHKR